MHTFSTHLTFIEDPGHGWLKVPLAELDVLGIRGQITPYSYINGEYAYLEEDVDAGTYLDARTAQQVPAPTIDQEYVHAFAGRTQYDRFPSPAKQEGER